MQPPAARPPAPETADPAALAWPEHAAAVLGWLGHTAAVLAVVLLAAYAARRIARLLRQPEVIGEITLGLAGGPLLLALAGPEPAGALLPPEVLAAIRPAGHAGMILFLVGVAYELRTAAVRVTGRAVAWTAAGAMVLPLVAGGALAAYVLAADPPVRGDAPALPLAVFLAAALTVTAVPVLARILADKAAVGTEIGQIAMTVAVVTDTGAWLLVALAAGMMAGGAGGLPGLGLALIGGLAALALARRLLGTATAAALSVRHPRIAALAVASAGLAAAGAMQAWGFTEIFGAVLVGFAIPAGAGAWHKAVGTVARIGHRLVPVFFVVTGIAVFTAGLGTVGWTLIALCVGLGVAGKAAGGYLGARMGGRSHADGLLLGVLLNTRGLTELVVLQAGYAAGILTPALYAALVVMALVTTGLTGPLYTWLTRRHRVPGQGPQALPPSTACPSGPAAS